jgi:cell division protein FtsL
MSGFLRLFERRIRGVRLIELIGLVLVFGMIFWVCLSKAREGDDIRRMNDLDQQIADEQTAVNALRIKVSQLERPERLETLATAYLGMKPVDPAHETDVSGISQISRTTSRAPMVPPPPPAPPAEAPITVSAGAAPAPVTLSGGAQ